MNFFSLLLFPNILKTDKFLQKELKCLAIAKVPPRYFSLPKSLNTRTGSFQIYPEPHKTRIHQLLFRQLGNFQIVKIIN